MPLKLAASHFESFDIATLRLAVCRLARLTLSTVGLTGLGAPGFPPSLAPTAISLTKFLSAAFYHPPLGFAKVAFARSAAPGLPANAFRPEYALVGINHQEVRPPHFLGDHLGDIRVAGRGQLIGYAIDRRLACQC